MIISGELIPELL